MPLRYDGETLTGSVKTIARQKGFGFIAAAGVEYFFHRSACPDFDRLTEGSIVTFTPSEPTNKGPRAEAVRLQ